jgi:hypothetical protein
MPRSSSRVPAATRTSSNARPRSLLDAVVTAARFQRGGRRARKKRAGAPLAVAARELRRLTSRSAAIDERHRGA